MKLTEIMVHNNLTKLSLKLRLEFIVHQVTALIYQYNNIRLNLLLHPTLNV